LELKQLTSGTVPRVDKQSLIAGYKRPALSSNDAPWEGIEVEVFDFTQPKCLRAISFSSVFVSTLRIGLGHLWTEHQRRLRVIMPGQTVIHPVGMSFGGVNPKPSGWITVYVKPFLLERVAAEFVNPAQIEIVPSLISRDPQIDWLSLTLEREVKDHYRSGRLFGEAVATALAAHLLAQYAVKPLTIREFRGGMSKYLLRRTIDYMQNNLGTNLRLSELADNVQMSQWHFCRMFKQSMGISPHQYLLRQRIEAAKKRLMRPNADLLEISTELGFNNRSHFTSIFRRLVGCTPTQFMSRF
jgi:AraC family transcriptional regulator